MRQLICSGVELPIGQLLVVKHDCDMIGSALDLNLKQMMDTPILGVFFLGLVPVNQQLLPFGWR